MLYVCYQKAIKENINLRHMVTYVEYSIIITLDQAKVKGLVHFPE